MGDDPPEVTHCRVSPGSTIDRGIVAASSAYVGARERKDAGPYEIAVLRHWIWTVGRSLAGMEIEHHLDAGPPRGAGSSVSVAITAAPPAPLQELSMAPCDSSLLIDQRWRPALGKYAAGFWDELDGLEKSDQTVALLRAVTATRRARTGPCAPPAPKWCPS